MNMTWIDWALVIGIMAFITYTAISTQKLTKSVADFLSANRCAGRYLLGISSQEAAMGAVSIIAIFEMSYTIGFAPGFWSALGFPLGLFLTLSGFVFYRYRQTRAMTLAQFFEMRYSRNFRIYAGILMWVSGTINFGVFPGVGARFFINFCGFPEYFNFLGITWTTFPVLMFILIGISLYFTIMGGQISVLVTDFWQGFFTTFIFAGLVAFLWFKFPWQTIGEGLVAASAPGKSLIDPFDIGQHRDFGIWFFAIGWFFNVYSVMAWQGTQGYNCSALTAHEAKMAGIVGPLRQMMVTLGLCLIPLCAITIMHHPEFKQVASHVVQELKTLYPDNEQLQKQMIVTRAISKYIPVGLIGAFTAAMIGFFISSHNTYMHSWGSIFVQDVLCPLRKEPPSTRQHLLFLRLSITFQAVFIFLFSWLYPIQDYIMMFFQITGAIFLGGAGSVIIGGLYWKRGTSAGAWAALSVGCVLSLTAIAAQQIWPHIPQKVASWYHLEAGQLVQLQGKTVIDDKWPAWQTPKNTKATETAAPRWYAVSEGFTFEMSNLKVGEKALEPLPETKIKKLRDGSEILVSAKTATINEVVVDRKAGEYIIRGRITEALGNEYYRVADETGEKTLIAKIAPRFPVNGQIMAFCCAIAAIISYITVSLVTSKGATANIDKLLHRGKYAVKDEQELIQERVKEEVPVGRFWRMIGVNGHEFSKVDKGLFLFTFLMSVWGMGAFVVLIFLASIGFMNDQRWLIWWRIGIIIMLVTAIVGACWVSIGGLIDLKKLYQRLRVIERNELDDGRVKDGHSVADETITLVGSKEIAKESVKDDHINI